MLCKLLLYNSLHKNFIKSTFSQVQKIPFYLSYCQHILAGYGFENLITSRSYSIIHPRAIPYLFLVSSPLCYPYFSSVWRLPRIGVGKKNAPEGGGGNRRKIAREIGKIFTELPAYSMGVRPGGTVYTGRATERWVYLICARCFVDAFVTVRLTQIPYGSRVATFFFACVLSAAFVREIYSYASCLALKPV